MIENHFLNNKDVTEEILDILKYKLIRSFIYFCESKLNYSKYTKYIEYFENEYISKICDELTSNPLNKSLYKLYINKF